MGEAAGRAGVAAAADRRRDKKDAEADRPRIAEWRAACPEAGRGLRRELPDPLQRGLLRRDQLADFGGRAVRRSAGMIAGVAGPREHPGGGRGGRH